MPAHGLTPAELTAVELGRFAAHGLTPAVLTAVELGKFAPHRHLLASEMSKLQRAGSQSCPCGELYWRVGSVD